MKKKLYLLLALLLAAAVIVVGVLFFANRGPQEQAADAPETPVIQLAEDLSVYWDRVENAESYIIKVNGSDLISTENPSFSVMSVPGTYKIQVQAVNQAGKSDYSNEVSYQTLGVTVPESELFIVLGAPVVGYGQDYTFTLEIAEGCTQCEPVVEVNGQVVTPDAGGKYTAANVTENLTVTVTGVELNSYPVTLTAGTGYTLSGEPVAYYGKDYTFTLTLKEGYSKSQPVVKANNVELAPHNGSYVIPNVTKPQQITVSGVAVNTYTVNLTTGRGYQISPSGAQTVSHGESIIFTVTADSPSYKIAVQADGKTLSAVNGKYTVADVTSNVQVSVTVTGLPALIGADKLLDSESWQTASVAYEGNDLVVSANSALKAEYFKSLWDAGYTHLVFTVNAKSAADNNTNYTHSGEWTRYWENFEPGKNVDLRIDLNEFHDGNTWYDLNFNAGSMTVSNPHAYKSMETLSWTKSNSNIYFAIENGYYVLETRGNDFGVTSPTQWLQKYVVEDEAEQRTWLVYTDYIKQGNNTRSVIWGWGSPVSTMNIGQWTAINNVQIDGYQPGEVFSLVLDRAGVARFKISDFISNRNTWGTFSFSKVSEDSITFSGAVDQKLRFFPTDELIASGYTHLQVTFSGHIGDSVIYFGNDEWGAEKYIIGVSKNELTAGNHYTYTANVDLSRMNGNLFTLQVAGAAVTDMTVRVQPVVLSTCNVTLPSGEGYTVSGEATAVSGSSYRFTLMLSEGYTKSNALVKVNGLELINATNGVYTVENVQEDLVITVDNIVLNTYTVTKPESEDYTVSGADSVTHGESYTFSVTANNPKVPLVVLVNGSVVAGTNGVYTVENVKADLIITVQATMPEPAAPKDILQGDSWAGTVLSANSNSLTLTANASLKGETLKSLWEAGYTHLVFTVNANTASDNNTNYTHSGTWSRFWATFQAGTNVDIRIDLNEFHDGDTWYSVNFNAGSMVVSNPRAYKSAETLLWTKSNSNIYFAIENGYYVLETRGNDFGVKSPTQWLKKYVVKDDADQRTWLMYTDYITKGSNTRSMIWGWGSPVNTITGNVNGGWSWNNNVSATHEVFSLLLDRAGTARFKLLDWVSNRNSWNNDLAISYVDAQTIRWSAASDYKLRLATTQDLIAQGYTTLKVTLTGNLGSAQIWYGDDDWGDGEICVSADSLVDGACTFEVDLTTFKPNENFTLMANAAAFTDLLVKIQPVNKNYCSITIPTGEGFVFTGADMIKPGEDYTFTVTPTGGKSLIVSVNGTQITGTDGTYTVSNVREDLVITVTAADQVDPLLLRESWEGNILESDGSSLKIGANATLKAEYLKGLWNAGYTHLVFTVNAAAAADNNTNYTHSGLWSRYWATFAAGKNVDLRIDLNEFHDSDIWYSLKFNAGSMTVSNPRAYSSSETLNWVKDNSSTYFAVEDGYYVLETHGNDFGVTAPTQWLKKYVVKDDADQRTWLMYTDYITKGSNTRSMIWGWGSPVNTITGNINGGWSWKNNVQADGYTEGEVFSLHLDRAGTARFKLLDWVSNRNEWNGALSISYVDEQTIRWSAASDYKLRLATTQDLIAQGYTTLKVTLTGNLGSAQIWYGDDDWGDGEICVSADSFVDGACTFEVDLTAFNTGENFTMMVNAAKIADLLVKIEPIAE